MEKMSRRLVSENISLKFFLDAKNSLVFIDSGQFEQVIINLVVNAKDAMPTGGSIIVETDDVHSTGDGKYHGIPSGNWVLVSVRDSGEGIAPENLQHIFEPFFTTKGADKGTGLGLSTVYAIVNQSGGRLAVESVPGRGANFMVYLPMVEGKPDRVDIKKLEPSPIQSRAGTILLAEDDDYLRGLLSGSYRRSAIESWRPPIGRGHHPRGEGDRLYSHVGRGDAPYDRIRAGESPGGVEEGSAGGVHVRIPR
jgi:hypothetical protein